MNPPGEWVFQYGTWNFLNNSIMAIYGKVFPVQNKNWGVMWKWECRVGLEARTATDLPIEGFSYTEEEAKNIVECVLKNTRTCEFKS